MAHNGSSYVPREDAFLDALIHVDRTRADEPFERTSEWTAGKPPETFPSAM